MNRTLPTRRANLAAGAALIGCTLAAADRASAAGNMKYATVTSLTLGGTGSYASTPGFVTLPNTNWSGSAQFFDGSETYTSTPITGGWVTTYFVGYNAGYDFIGAYTSSSWYTGWNLSGTFGITLSQTVTVELFNGGSWLIDGVSLTDGQTIAAGSYTFSWAYTGSTGFVINGLGFHGAGGGVPLPGAAGLAACGLLGISRRRRR